MRIEIDKRLALTLYCLARQGERSIDFSLSSARQWALLRDYYQGERRHRLLDLLGELERLALRHPEGYSRDQWGRAGPGWVLAYPVLALINRWRTRWLFSEDQVSFFVTAMTRLVQALSCETQPTTALLIDLRLDLYLCQWILEKKLVGVPFLRSASTIEHFCQADHLPSISWSQLQHQLAARTA